MGLLEEIHDLEKQILELKSSQAFKDLEVSNRWDKKKQIPSDPEAEKAWNYLKKDLEYLVGKKELIQDRFQDQRKLQSKQYYKTRAAVISERSYLTTIACQLDKYYIIAWPFSKPNFGTVLSIYRNPGSYKLKKESYPPMEQLLSQTQWKLLAELNDRVNEQLHSELSLNEDGKFTARFTDTDAAVNNYRQILVELDFVKSVNDLDFDRADEESP
jgi:hypothetical protein